METLRILVTPSNGLPYYRELPTGPEFDSIDMATLLNLRGGERVEIVQASIGRRVEINDLVECQ